MVSNLVKRQDLFDYVVLLHRTENKETYKNILKHGLQSNNYQNNTNYVEDMDLIQIRYFLDLRTIQCLKQILLSLLIRMHSK